MEIEVRGDEKHTDGTISPALNSSPSEHLLPLNVILEATASHKAGL